MPVPIVIETIDQQERVLDIYSRLLQDRIVMFGTSVTDETSNRAVAQLLYLHKIDPKADITLMINSPGGSVSAGLGIYDVMQFISNDVKTVCLGQAASMGAILLTAGTKGKRFALPNSRIMIHQPMAGMEGTATDLEIHTKEVLKVKKKLNEILLSHTGQTLEQIEKDTDRDYFLSAEEAVSYGIIDSIVDSINNL